MSQSDSASFRAGTAYTVMGRPIIVSADRLNGTVELDIDGQRHVLNLGHLEQLDNAVRRALIWMANGED